MKKYGNIELDRVKIFYANYRNVNNILTVSHSKGDYVTIWSVTIKSQSTIQNLIINGNEKTVSSSNKEICFPIDFKDEFSLIAWKLYVYTIFIISK
jgi:hypothetical protein